MSLPAGYRLGPYEILAPIGAGGMGEVYRARDTRLAREVAIKVLPAQVSADQGRLRRFEKEARSASALNHPNIVTIHDIGLDRNISYIAMELVEGGTLRELMLGGPLSIKKLLQIAPQGAEGLAKAHEEGIVHRDLKPENVMVKKDGLVKILDFGLAKLTQPDPESGQETKSLTVSAGTEPGVVMGTVGYMSPEQALGKPVDFRSDQFSFGSILYEMATGRRAFSRSSTPETMSAIIRDDPEPIGTLNPKAPTPFRWVAERCLAKEPKDRYASTDDLARDLATIRDRLSEAMTSGTAVAAAAPRVPPRLRFLALGLALAAALTGAAYVGKLFLGKPPAPLPSYHRLTFRRGRVSGAQFAPDGQTIVYSAAFEDRPFRLFLTRPDSPESLELPLPDADLRSISALGEMAITLGSSVFEQTSQTGRQTLATVPLAGGSPREIQRDVSGAAWSPDGKGLAIVRQVKGMTRLEYPAGKVLYEIAGGLGSVRFSPSGDAIAFVENRQSILAVDLAGHLKLSSLGWRYAGGVCWSPAGDELWFSASKLGLPDTLRALSLSGKQRLLARIPGWIQLQDVSRDGRALLEIGTPRWEVWSLSAGEAKERDLSWLGMSEAVDLSPDGKMVLFNEHGDGGGPSRAAYMRPTDGSAAKKLFDGTATGMSPDGRWISAIDEGPPPKLKLVPTGAGESRTLALDGIEEIVAASWFQDGVRLLLGGRERGREVRFYMLRLGGGKPFALTPEGSKRVVVSPDGKLLAVEAPAGEFWIYPVDGGQRRPLPGPSVGESLMRWSTDGASVFVCDFEKVPLRVYRVDLAGGRRDLWKTIVPPDRAGLFGVELYITPDGQSYILNSHRWVNDLYLVEGLK